MMGSKGPLMIDARGEGKEIKGQLIEGSAWGKVSLRQARLQGIFFWDLLSIYGTLADIGSTNP